jgi:hypothetical protein
MTTDPEIVKLVFIFHLYEFHYSNDCSNLKLIPYYMLDLQERLI